MVVVQSVLFTVYLFYNAEKERKTRILQLITLIVTLHFSNLILGRTVPNYAGYGLSWIFLATYGPLIYGYSKCFVKGTADLKYFHFLVPLYVVFLWCFTDKMHRESAADQYFDFWLSLPIYGVFLIYLALSMYFIYSAKEVSINLKWLKYIVQSFSILIILHLIVLFTYSSGQGNLANVLYVIEIIYMLFFVSGMVFTAMSKPTIFVDMQKLLDSIPRPPKYFYTKLGKQEADSILLRLEKLMEEEKPYLDPNQNLESMSRKLDVQKRHISQIINERLKVNFKEYINGYRIRAAMNILNQPKMDIRIFEVMYDVGFSSKSSFNQAFKKYTGQTPTDYRESVLKRDTTLP